MLGSHLPPAASRPITIDDRSRPDTVLSSTLAPTPCAAVLALHPINGGMYPIGLDPVAKVLNAATRHAKQPPTHETTQMITMTSLGMRALVILGLLGPLVLGTGSMASAQDRSETVDWPLHNLDLAGSRFSSLDQINRSNVHTLTPRWLFQHGVIDGVSNQTTPIIVDGVMYATDSCGSVYAVDGADGHLLWSYDVTELLGGGLREGYIFRHRGVTYADGVVYSAAGSFIFALDAETGEPMPEFGENGQASVILDVLRLRCPEVETAISMGYWFTSAPQIHDGVLYAGSTRSESHIPGGHVLAVDAQTGEVIWRFNTIPQDENDQGWDVAGPTWVGGERNGGSIWETPSIDPELGLVYVAVGNPYGDSTKRAGMNLFSDSVLALSMENGRLEWYYQLVHHDVWDYDNGLQPILFDMEVDGQPVKALAQANKNGWLYILDRATGEPVHPIIETPVSTLSDTPGEQPWPTQPIPLKANGDRMEPVTPVYPTKLPPGRIEGREIVPQFTPHASNHIFAPGRGGGASYAPITYSPLTKALFMTVWCPGSRSVESNYDIRRG